VVAWAATRATAIGGLVAAIGAVGAVLLAVVLWRGAEELLAWALLAAGAAYGIALAVHGGRVDAAAPLVAAGLLLCGELAVWSLDARWRIAAEEAVVRRRATALGALVLAGVAVAALVVSIAVAPAGSGLPWTTVGAVAAVGAVAIGVALARRAE
jgi:hypothetical protein